MRQRILNAAYSEFRRRGFSRVGVDEVAAAAKVTKRTLYYHFDSKDELLAEMLQAQHELVLKSLQELAEQYADEPSVLIEKLFASLTAWSTKPRWAGSGYTRVAMELADLPGHPARIVAKRHKAMLESYLADLLARGGVAEAPARAREVLMLLEGAMALILIHGDPRYGEAAGHAALKLIAGARRPDAKARRKPGRKASIV